MIAFDRLSIGFHNKEILKNLSGQIKPGELIALMGVNGAGKSCLLKTLTQLNPPLGGELTIEGKNIEDLKALEVAKMISVVLTEKIHADFLTVSELLILGRSPHTNFWGSLKEDDEKKITEALELLKITHLKDKFFTDLSDGQKQKVLLARALIQEPKYLFLDEPTTYLDIPSKIELMKMLRNLSLEKGIGVFFSTHDLNFIEKEVDFIWLIDEAGILHKKSPEEMHQSGLLKKNFNL